MGKMANVEGLVARRTGKNSCTWYFRLSVPKSDQKRGGCKEIWESLRTSDKATAVRRLPDAIKRANSKLANRLNARPSGSPTSLPPTGLAPAEIARLSVRLAEEHYLSVKRRD